MEESNRLFVIGVLTSSQSKRVENTMVNGTFDCAPGMKSYSTRLYNFIDFINETVNGDELCIGKRKVVTQWKLIVYMAVVGYVLVGLVLLLFLVWPKEIEQNSGPTSIATDKNHVHNHQHPESDYSNTSDTY